MLYNHLHLLLTVLWQFLLKPAEMKIGTRNKRILYGHPSPHEHRDNYPSFRYYVFLAKSSHLTSIEDPSWIRSWMGLTNPSPSELKCGGSLLTPSIVQTACHCISHYHPKKKGDNLTYARPLNVWEDRIYSFFGSNEVTRMKEMLIPSHYITYESCRQLGGSAAYNMNDYGLIITKDSVNTKAPDARISYAPAYFAAQIQDFYYKTVQREHMCLFIGHGAWYTVVDDDGEPQEVNERSEEIRWGWQNIMNYGDCLAATYEPDEREEFYFDYKGEATWVCAYQNFHTKPWGFMTVPGDSGGPVTCSDVYFSIVSFSSTLYMETHISWTSPIAHTHYENAAEYRDDLIKFFAEYNKPDVPLPHPEYPEFTVTPPDIYVAAYSPQNLSPVPLIILAIPVLFIII